MLLTVLLLYVPSVAPPAWSPEPSPVSWATQDRKEEYSRKRKEAEGDVAKLWDLHDWCDSFGMTSETRSVLRAIVKIDPDDKKARDLLGDIAYDGKWFTSEKAVLDYKTKALAEEAKRTGKVIFKGTLVDKQDLPYLQRGLVRNAEGHWVDAEELAKLAAGWVRHDLEWVPPEEADNIEKGLWKCGEKWLGEQEADEFHKELDQCWRIPTPHFILYTTLPRKVAAQAADEIERAFRECARVLGRMPEDRVAVLLLRSSEQYNRFAQGEDAAVELRALSSCHGAFLAEVWLEPLQRGLPSAGVAYWDFSTETGNRFGPTFARSAAAMSVVEAVDGSPKAIEKLLAGQTNNFERAFLEEKLLPEWLRAGAAAYAERYLLDSLVGAGADAAWLRKWSVSNIANKGGLDSLDAIFSAVLSVDDCAKTAKMMNQAGLLVAFILDGKVPEVSSKHAVLKQTLNGRNAKEVQQAVKELQASIKKNEAALRTFAGI